LVFIFLSNILCAQADFKGMAKLPLMTQWKVGESLQYELVKSKFHYTDTLMDSKNEVRQSVTLTVAAKNTEGYLIEAVYGSPGYFLPDEIRKLRNADSLVEKYREFSVKYSIKSSGEFVKIENVAEIRQMLSDLFDSFAQTADTSATTKEVLKNLKAHITAEAFITEGLFQELKLYHQFHGMEYAIDQSQSYETFVANLLEPHGAPIPAHAQLNVELREGSYCLIEHSLAPDALILKKLVGEYIQKMSGDAFSAQSTEGINFDVKDSGKYAYHWRSGWLVEMLKRRAIITDTDRQEEFVEMRLLKGNF
jgi:hypothetical protein